METVKITVEQAGQIENAVKQLVAAKLPIPAMTSFEIACIGEAVQKINRPFQAVQTELIKKYGKEDGKGNITVKNENAVKYHREITELLSAEREIEVADFLYVSDFPEDHSNEWLPFFQGAMPVVKRERTKAAV